MITGTRNRVLALGALLLLACGGDDACENEDCAGPGGGGGEESESLLGDSAASHSEAQETNNGSSAEATGYVLETENGLEITGSFESSSPTPDGYVFNSGALGTAGRPGFPGVDIQIVIDGKVLGSGAGVSLNLDTVQELGYSSLLGTNYFMNAALFTGKDYGLRMTPSAALAGKSYTVEIRGHVVSE